MMDDLISRRAAINIADALRDYISVKGYWAWMERLKKLPSAQPEIIRCKGCEYWYPEEDDEYGHCRKHDFWTSGSWYCADGDKRRT